MIDNLRPIARPNLSQVTARSLSIGIIATTLLVGIQIGKAYSGIDSKGFIDVQRRYSLCLIDPLCVSPNWSGVHELEVGQGIGWFIGDNGAVLPGVSLTDVAFPNYVAFEMLVALGFVISGRYTDSPFRKMSRFILSLSVAMCAIGWISIIGKYSSGHAPGVLESTLFVATTIAAPQVVAKLVQQLRPIRSNLRRN